MEETGFRRFWKKHGTIVMLFLIRIAEVFASSIVPSTLGVILVFINPNKHIWTIINFVSLILFGFINFRFLLKYIAGRDNKREFYVLNGIVYIIYILTSLALYKWGGYLIYSVIFADLRGLEAFGLKTIQSILICDAIIMATMVVLGQIAYNRTEFVKEIIRENGADEIEMDMSDDVVPMQNDKEIETLSLEEMDREIEEEAHELDEFVKRQSEAMANADWLKNMKKGDGSEVEFVTPTDPDNDIDEHDYVEANALRENEFGDYSGDALWSKDFYHGEAPITSYEDEEPQISPEGKPTVGDMFKRFVRHHVRSVTRTAHVNNENRKTEEAFFEEDGVPEDAAEAAESDIAYDAESLWDSKAYQGRDSNDKPKEYAEEPDDAEPEEIPTAWLDDYDSDNLWNAVQRDRVLHVDEAIKEEEENAGGSLDEYDYDSLWSGDMVQGSKKK